MNQTWIKFLPPFVRARLEKGKAMKALGEFGNMSRTVRYGFAAVLAVKLVLLCLFSSDYQNRLFIPFVEHFVRNFDNSWDYFYRNDLPVEFPYPPLMLYILSLFTIPIAYVPVDSVVLKNLLFKLPLLAADLLITALLLRMFPQRQKEVLIYYFLAPIVLYGIYVHSQLDLIPAALLFVSVYLLIRRKIGLSAVAFGMAISTKFYVAACLPLMMIYVFRNCKSYKALYFLLIPAAVYLFFAFPYIQSQGYYHLVLKNPKQMQIFDVVHNVKDLSVYLPIFAVFVTYTRFYFYKKINDDLFFTFLGLLFSLFLLLIYPAPAWYVWMFPFLSIFFIRFAGNGKLLHVFAVLNLIYLLFFVFLFVPEYQDIIFVGMPVDLKLIDVKLRNIVYTVFEATLLGCVYLFYKHGIRSNAVYNKNYSTLIGIGGDSGAGKSTLLKSLQLLLKGKILEIEGDGEHRWERHDKNWDQYTHLDPKSNLLHNQANYLLSLKRGNAIYRRDYDHATGRFTPPMKVEPTEVIVLSGLHPFYLPIMRKILDLKIYIDTDESLRQHWKIIRDTEKRGYTREKILQQMERRATDARKFVLPQRELADIVVNYFATAPFEVGIPEENPAIGVKVTLDSSVNLEKMVDQFLARNVVVEWEYSGDLQTQYVVLHEAVGSKVIREIAEEVIINLSDLVSRDGEWQEGCQGFVQLVVMLALSIRMRGENDGL